MKLFQKIKESNGYRHIYFCGIKILSYKNWKGYDLSYGTKNYNKVKPCSKFSKETHCFPKITIIYPVYYSNKKHEEGLKKLLKRYEAFSSETKKNFEIILVDDCSPHPLSLPKVNLNITLLRIKKDIKWNNSGARNLGACYASTPKIMLLDIDLFCPEKTLKNCIDIDLKYKDVMVFKVIRTNPTVHPNLYCMTKKTFFDLGCYDESWCGFYGEDIFYNRYINSHGANIILLDNNEIIDTKAYGTHNLSRSVDKVRKRLYKMKTLEHKKEILKFPWEYVESNQYIESQKG